MQGAFPALKKIGGISARLGRDMGRLCLKEEQLNLRTLTGPYLGKEREGGVAEAPQGEAVSDRNGFDLGGIGRIPLTQGKSMCSFCSEFLSGE